MPVAPRATLTAARLAIARENGFGNWTRLNSKSSFATADSAQGSA
jgi:hypothetical protein